MCRATSSERATLLVVLFAFMVSACASATPSQPVAQEKIDPVAERVQTIRQLHFVKPVPLVVMSREDVKAKAESQIMRNHTDEELRARSSAAAFLGRSSYGLDIKSRQIDFYRAYVMGLYDPVTKEMLLVSRGNGSGVIDQRSGKMFLAHEFTHALQDQNFGLDRDRSNFENSDRAFAFRLVGEGDATITEYAYDAGRMDDSVLNNLTSQLDPLHKPPNPAVTIVEGPVIARYADGINFVAEAYRRGGWQGVDALYGKPPLSMHQLLHPSDYFDHPRPPVDVVVRGYESELSTYSTIARDTYGEVPLQQIIQRDLGKEASRVSLAEKWAGDQLAILKAPDGRLAVIWILVFSSQDAAVQFADLYPKILDKALGKTKHQLERRDATILVIAGVPGKTLAPSVWSASTIDGHSVASTAGISR